MSSAVKGVLILLAIVHLFLILIPLMNTLQSSISRRSKLFWSAFLLLLPFVGAAIFHFFFRASVFQEESHETKRAYIEAERKRHSLYGNDDHN